MGEAKMKATKTAMTSEERETALGLDPFAPAFDLVFGMIEAVFTQTGGVTHELIGIDFDAGKPTGVNVLVVRRVEDAPRLRAQMLEKWSMVVHVFEAWAAPDQSVPPHAHPLRTDIVSVMLHTSDMAASASCRVDTEKKTVQRDALIFVDQIGGRLGRELPQRH